MGAGQSGRGRRPSAARNRGAGSRVLRIIGGTWRGRRLRFPASADIRPTSDRVRETLFNWLAPLIGGARCLDLFAGSGALGLEALSRGASQVTFVERDAKAAQEIRAHLSEWGAAGKGRVVHSDALRFLQGPAERYDIVFLDPPFASDLLAAAAERLNAGAWLAPDARIYVERAARDGGMDLPHDWRQVRTKQAGEVGYHLFELEPKGPRIE